MKRIHTQQSVRTAEAPDIEPHIGRTLNDVERDLIIATLSRCGGNRGWAADILGISQRTLRIKLLRHNDSMSREGAEDIVENVDEDEDAMTARLRYYDPGNRLPS